MDTTMNAAYYRHIFSAEEAAKIRDSIIGLYGKCDNFTAVKAYHDGIITSDELRLLRWNTRL